IGDESTEWTTWSGATGGAEDAQVTMDEANSGSNSIYFSSTSATGGPQDVVLPFGGEYNLGTLTYEMYVNVESGNGGYFNFQANETIGQVWAMDCYFVDNGTMIIATQGTQHIITSYDFDVWNKMTFNINLTTNDWEFIFNDVSLGSFVNPENQIASIDLFPINSADFDGNGNSSFWVDDVSYEYTPYELAGLNLGAVNNILEGQGIAGQEKEVSGLVRNLGLEEINSFDIEMSYNGNTYNESVSGLTLGSLDFYTHVFADVITLAPGVNDLSVTVSNINGMGDDNDSTDDTKVLSLDPPVPAENKLVICEEATGTWCPWCPRGAVMMDRATANYPEFFIGIAVHNGDPMTVDAYDQGLATVPGFSGYPSATVDRHTVIDPLGIESDFLQRIIEEPAGIIETGAGLSLDESEITISLNAIFSEAITGNYKIACVLVEDGVTGTTSDYAQANAYAGGTNGEMGGYETLPTPVPAADMVYDHVARAISPSFAGLPNAFTDVVVGADNIYNFTFTVDAEWDLSEMHVVGMIINPDGTINNGSTINLDDALVNGIEEGTDVVGIENLDFNPGKINIYPNPTQGWVQFDLIPAINEDVIVEIYSATGQLLASKNHGTVQGATTFPINLSSYESGIYLISVQHGDTFFSQRVTKQ
ncbi:MAG: Omp28-related outer membrane protein, partial [Saprospiraceae bacterium]